MLSYHRSSTAEERLVVILRQNVASASLGETSHRWRASSFRRRGTYYHYYLTGGIPILSPANLYLWGSYSDADIKSAQGFPALSAYATDDAYKRLVTREEIQGLLLTMGVRLASIAIAVLGGEAAISWASHAYLLLLPVVRINGYVMDSCGKRSQGHTETSPHLVARQEGVGLATFVRPVSTR